MHDATEVNSMFNCQVLQGSIIVQLKVICNDFLVVKVNCLSSVFNIIKSI